MTQPDLARLEGLLGKAVQEEDDIRYYSGGSKHSPARDAFNQAVALELPALFARVRELEKEHAAAGRNLYRMQTDNAALALALRQCGDQFQFYANEHTAAGKTDKAATNQRFAGLAILTLNRSETDAG